jgi:hypothetical protein
LKRPRIITAPTATRLPADAAGQVLVTGSHGGRYVGMLVAQAGVRAVIFHDAGIGLAQAGVASLAMLARFGVVAAAVSHMSARVGDTADMLARGVISRANAPADALGITRGMPCAQAAELLLAAPLRTAQPDRVEEARVVLRPEGAVRPLVLIDSASLVTPEDAGAVIVTGSHGGLVGGDPAMALRAPGFAAAFNDAGIGIEQAGIGRLAALEARGIAAITVAAGTARIGEARSTFEDGVISAANDTPIRLGAKIGGAAKPLLLAWTRKETSA